MKAEPPVCRQRRFVTFAVTAVATSLAILAVLRTSWVEGRLLLPLAQIQQHIAGWYGARSEDPIAVGVSCSGADVIALCLGVILAFPAPRRSRVTGAVLGVGLILLINTVRIGTLWSLSGSPGVFSTVHLYIWPAAIALFLTGYVFLWMNRQLDKKSAEDGTTTTEPVSRRFIPRAVLSLCAFAAAAPWIVDSEAVTQLAETVAVWGAAILSSFGAKAEASHNLLVTTRGAFRVTGECVATPLVAVYVAAAWALRWPWWARGLAAAAAVPLFFLLAVIRVLVLAVPPALVESPVILVHAFFQIVVAAVIVVVVAFRRGASTKGSRAHAAARAALALTLGLTAAVVVGPLHTSIVLEASEGLSRFAPHVLLELAPPGDVQGALLTLPAYQLGLFVALVVAGARGGGWKRFLVGAGLLALTQVFLLAALGELEAHGGVTPHALWIRGWAVVCPASLAFLVSRKGSREQRDRSG